MEKGLKRVLSFITNPATIGIAIAQMLLHYTHIDICYVANGRHSTSIGNYLKQGTLEAKSYDITPLFYNIYSDGRKWYNIHTKKEISEKKGVSETKDFRIGFLFEISKKIYFLSKDLKV